MTSVFSTLVSLSASLLRRLIRSQGDLELTYFRPCAEFGLIPSQFVHLLPLPVGIDSPDILQSASLRHLIQERGREGWPSLHWCDFSHEF
jgi:hypothetical protein